MDDARSTSAARLRRLPVRVADHTVGRSSDLIFDAGCRRLTGFEIEALSERKYFLPLAAARLGGDGIAIESALHLVDDTSWYESGGLALSALLELRACAGAHDAGSVVDLRLAAADGDVLAFVLDGERLVPRNAAELTASVLRLRRRAGDGG